MNEPWQTRNESKLLQQTYLYRLFFLVVLNVQSDSEGSASRTTFLQIEANGLKNYHEGKGIRILYLVKKFVQGNQLAPDALVINNVVEENTWKALSTMNTDGGFLRDARSFDVIIDTKIGKLAG